MEAKYNLLLDYRLKLMGQVRQVLWKYLPRVEDVVGAEQPFDATHQGQGVIVKVPADIL